MGDNKECNKKAPSDDIEDDSGLELSLGLSFGGYASKTKGRDSSKELNPEQGGNDKLINGKVSVAEASMKHFLQASIGEQNTEMKQLNESTFQPQQNFWMSLGKNSAKEPENSMEMHMNQVQFPGFREAWLAGEKPVQVSERTISMEKTKGDSQQTQSTLNQQHETLEQQNARELSDQKWQESRKKRKMVVEEQKQHKKGEEEDERANMHGKISSSIPSVLKTSPISATTQDVSSPDNEDTADSETEISSSRIVSTMATGTDVLEKKESQTPVIRNTTVGSESNSELSNTPCMTPVTITSTTLPYSLQSFPVVPVPYSHPIPVHNNSGVPLPAGFSLPYLVQFMPPTVNGPDRATARPMNSSGFQLPLGYAPLQLPTLETTPSWVSFSHSQQSSAWARNMGGTRASLEHVDDESRVSQAAIQPSQGALGGLRPGASEAASQECQKTESTKFLMKDERQVDRTGDLSNSDVGGTCLSSQVVDNDAKSHGHAWPRESVDHLSMTDGLSQEVLNLRPGIAAGLKFGGTGNLPDLPWVSTTGPGPNGKTISGAMYRYNRNQVRIVCACHGRHMSPSEFVQHAVSTEVSNSENDIVNSFSNGSQATSA